MNFKQEIIENAWGGINIDYGLLHLQLATPVTALILILVMIYALNKLLFQPVLRSLDHRRETVQKSLKHSERISKELESLQVDFQLQLEEARKSVMEIHQSKKDEGIRGREEMIQKKRQELEDELKKQSEQLQHDFTSAQQQFIELTKRLSSQVSERFLN